MFDFAEDAADNPTFYADVHEPQSLNKYQYCYNNPFSFIDPDGHKSILKVRRLRGTSTTGMVATEVSIAQSPNPAVSAVGVGLVGLAIIGEALIGRPARPAPWTDTTTPAQEETQPVAPPAQLSKEKSDPPPTGPDEAKADRDRKKADKRTKKERKQDRKDKAKEKTKKTDDHTGEGPHHRDNTQGGRRGPRKN